MGIAAMNAVANKTDRTEPEGTRYALEGAVGTGATFESTAAFAAATPVEVGAAVIREPLSSYDFGRVVAPAGTVYTVVKPCWS